MAPHSASLTRTAQTEAPLLGVLAERWSPRSFDTDIAVTDEQLGSLLEAARWSPSANNTQPWRFVVARRGTPEFESITANLMGFNQAWAGSAAILIVALAETVSADGRPQKWSSYDVGQAMAHLSVQAHHDGLHVHQMGGFEAEGLRAAFSIDPRLDVMTVSAVGILAHADALPEPLREREVAPRARKPLDELLVVTATA